MRPVPPREAGEADASEAERVLVRGAVLLRAHAYDADAVDPSSLSRELAAARDERAPRAGRALARALAAHGAAPLVALALGLGLAAAGLVLEAAVLASALEVGRSLAPSEQRLIAFGALLVLALALLVLELPLASLVQRVARGVETRLRLAFLRKLPRLERRYFKSRPVSDMAERAHAVHRLREVVPLAAAAWRTLAEVLLLSVGLAWLAPRSLPLIVALALACVLPPLLGQRPLTERDLRLRTHEGALGRFHLDALLGSVPAAAHGAERAMLAEHEGLLVQWARAGRSTVAGTAAFTLVHGFLVHALAAWIVVAELSRQAEPAASLLLVLWVMTLVWLAEPLGLCARAWPTLRNLTLRLLEPLGAPEGDHPTAEPAIDAASATETRAGSASRAPGPERLASGTGGVAVELADVTVHAGGHELLRELSLTIPAGSHLAVVGASGAGKSSLCGLLLGWHVPTSGSVRVDGLPLDAGTLQALRRRTAWLDPEVQLWNRPLADNVRYGAQADGDGPDLAELCAAAELHALLPHLPQGLQTPLGESGALVSGGEGQRVRAARAFGRARPRLVVLDEALRGLDRERRQTLLRRARARFADATLIHVTHRLEEALDFERVLVIDGGRVVEDGSPAELARREGSRFAELLAHEEACDAVWHDPRWRRVELDRGRLREAAS